MRGVYRFVHDKSLSAAGILYRFNAPANRVLQIYSVEITNRDVETNEQMDIELARIVSAGDLAAGTDRSSLISKTEPGDGAAGVTIGEGPTQTTATFDTFKGEGVGSLAGFYYRPIPEDREIIAVSGIWVIRLKTALSGGAVAGKIEVRWRELG